MYLDCPGFEDLLTLALREDIGSGDITTLVTLDDKSKGDAEIIAKEPMVLAGIGIIYEVFKRIDPALKIVSFHKDGEKIDKGTPIAQVSGRYRAILMGERVALNFLQRLCGIATLTAEMVRLIEDLPVRLVDTRKTTPGFRTLEKMAVRCGGGFNHRFGLYDGILIKDNHIMAKGSIYDVVKEVRAKVPHTLRIEVEVKDLGELKEAMAAGVDIVLLDNFSISDLTRAVAMAKGTVLLEASGGINKKNLRAVAETGVDFISMGGLTHSARAVDISLNIIR